MVLGSLRAAHRRSDAGVAGDRLRRARTDLRTDRIRKTLAAFLYAIDQLANDPDRDPDPKRRKTSLVYVSPLKALSYDIDRNLRTPLRGIGTELEVAVRTGDTPQRERQRMLREPPTSSSPHPSRST